VPATPISYNHFFYKVLHGKDISFQKQIGELLEMEKVNYSDDALEMEKNIRRSHHSIKQLLMACSTILKGANYLKKILDEDARSNERISKVLKLLEDKEIEAKKEYKNIISIFKEIQASTNINLMFEVYNKNYLLERINQEIALVSNFQRSSSFMFIEIHNDSIKAAKQNETIIKVFKKAAAKILKKTVRKSDCVGYYDKGLFGIVLPHTNIDEAENLAKRIHYGIEHGSVMIGKTVQSIKVAIGITPIFPHQTTNEVLGFCMNAIDDFYKSKHKYCGIYLGYCSILEKKKNDLVDLGEINTYKIY